MTQIAATDAALVRLLESCDLPGVTVLSAPHEWDAGYVQRLVSKTPAVLVAFHGGDQYDDGGTSNTLDLAGKWSAYIVVGWNSADQAARRIGAGAGFDLMHRVAAILHTAILEDENGERLPSVRVEGVGVETDSALDIANLWIGTVALDINLPLPLLETEACYGPLDDFLRARGGFDLPDVGKPRPATAEDAATDADLSFSADIDPP